MRLRLLKGDISRVSANAIVTSANDALCGNDQPLYWRFTNPVSYTHLTLPTILLV